MKVNYSFNGTYHKAVIYHEDQSSDLASIPYPAVFWAANKTDLEEQVAKRLRELNEDESR